MFSIVRRTTCLGKSVAEFTLDVNRKTNNMYVHVYV
jgi:hypothetical protein